MFSIQKHQISSTFNQFLIFFSLLGTCIMEFIESGGCTRLLENNVYSDVPTYFFKKWKQLSTETEIWQISMQNHVFWFLILQILLFFGVSKKYKKNQVWKKNEFSTNAKFVVFVVTFNQFHSYLMIFCLQHHF